MPGGRYRIPEGISNHLCEEYLRSAYFPSLGTLRNTGVMLPDREVQIPSLQSLQEDFRDKPLRVFIRVRKNILEAYYSLDTSNGY